MKDSVKPIKYFFLFSIVCFTITVLNILEAYKLVSHKNPVASVNDYYFLWNSSEQNDIGDTYRNRTWDTYGNRTRISNYTRIFYSHEGTTVNTNVKSPHNISVKILHGKFKLQRLCPQEPLGLVGRIDVTANLFRIIGFNSTKYMTSIQKVLPGGKYKPPNCQAREKTAVIIPFRKREEHLRVFLLYLHEILQRQTIDYTIYVVEYVSEVFNRGMAVNIGYLVAKSIESYTCYIIHDVDKLPEDDRNLYQCEDNPCLLSSAQSQFRYRLPYEDYFSGVIAFTPRQFEKINGFSNFYFGWGGEDDDLRQRVVTVGMKVNRRDERIGRYYTPKHDKDAEFKENDERFKLLKTASTRMFIDGLSSVRYDKLEVEPRDLYTYVYTEANMTSVLKNYYENYHLSRKQDDKEGNRKSNFWNLNRQKGNSDRKYKNQYYGRNPDTQKGIFGTGSRLLQRDERANEQPFNGGNNNDGQGRPGGPVFADKGQFERHAPQSHFGRFEDHGARHGDPGIGPGDHFFGQVPPEWNRPGQMGNVFNVGQGGPNRHQEVYVDNRHKARAQFGQIPRQQIYQQNDNYNRQQSHQDNFIRPQPGAPDNLQFRGKGIHHAQGKTRDQRQYGLGRKQPPAYYAANVNQKGVGPVQPDRKDSVNFGKMRPAAVSPVQPDRKHVVYNGKMRPEVDKSSLQVNNKPQVPNEVGHLQQEGNVQQQNAIDIAQQNVVHQAPNRVDKLQHDWNIPKQDSIIAAHEDVDAYIQQNGVGQLQQIQKRLEGDTRATQVLPPVKENGVSHLHNDGNIPRQSNTNAAHQNVAPQVQQNGVGQLQQGWNIPGQNNINAAHQNVAPQVQQNAVGQLHQGWNIPGQSNINAAHQNVAPQVQQNGGGQLQQGWNIPGQSYINAAHQNVAPQVQQNGVGQLHLGGNIPGQNNISATHQNVVPKVKQNGVGQLHQDVNIPGQNITNAIQQNIAPQVQQNEVGQLQHARNSPGQRDIIVAHQNVVPQVKQNGVGQLQQGVNILGQSFITAAHQNVVPAQPEQDGNDPGQNTMDVVQQNSMPEAQNAAVQPQQDKNSDANRSVVIQSDNGGGHAQEDRNDQAQNKVDAIHKNKEHLGHLRSVSRKEYMADITRTRQATIPPARIQNSKEKISKILEKG